MTETRLTPAGWHPDPELPQMQRYWDGTRWTDHRAPVAQQQRGSEGLVVAGYVTAVLLPFVGFIIGCILLGKDRTGHGIGAILLSIVAFFVFWPLVVLGGLF